MPEQHPCWHKVSVGQAFVVSGGASNRKHILNVIEVDSVSGPRTFARVTKNEAWLLHCTVGRWAHKGSAKRSNVLENLKAKLIAASCDGESEPAVAENDDPMSALEELGPQPSPKKKGYSLKRWRDRIIDLHMPRVPLLSDKCAGPADTYTVSVLARSTNQLWIDTANIEWLVNFVAKEIALGGVPEEEPAVAESNCEVDFLRIQWDFGEQCWRAEFVGGPLAGESFIARVSTLTSEKWALVWDPFVCDFAAASFEDRKECTRLYLQDFCARKLQTAGPA